jgi:hypothetical protein
MRRPTVLSLPLLLVFPARLVVRNHTYRQKKFWCRNNKNFFFVTNAPYKNNRLQNWTCKLALKRNCLMNLEASIDTFYKDF